ncbi:MAG: virulence-associated E family protein [Cytophagales bacterium]|nr:virulence-associated E family protein [Cytophagales bacterium]
MSKKEIKIASIENFIFSKYDLRMNILSREIEYKNKGSDQFKLLNINDLMYELLHAGFKGFREDFQILLASSRIQRYDPLEYYYQTLDPYEPRTEPDYILELSKYVITDNPEWFKVAIKKFLIQVVAQALGKIPFNKFCFTLVGSQHDGKTSLIEWLIPAELARYSRKGFDFGSKESKFSLIQNMFINLDELASFDKKHINKLFKSVLSECSVKFRPLYSNMEESHPRRASFFASTNEDVFLTDETGNVRWLVFRIVQINHDHGGPNGYGNIPKDRLWAQMYFLLSSGFDFNFSEEEIRIIEKENLKYTKITPEVEYIRKFIQKSDKHETGSDFKTALEILEYLQRYGLTRSNEIFIGKALTSEGFVKRSKYFKNIGHSLHGYWIKYHREN